jgi:DnaJ-class molecular chaperone
MVSGQKKVCPSCGGSGQIQFFQGESRFLLTVEECPECCGTGYLLLEKNDSDSKSKPDTPEQRRQVK